MFNPAKNLVIYGRNTVLEALQNHQLPISKIHIADSNRSAKILDQICELSERRDISVEYKSKLELSRISKNSKQDQGVAADIQLPSMHNIDELSSLVETTAQPRKMLLLDGVNNPQNVGMIIRSVAASGVDGLILPKKGCADLGPLVIKASAGAIFNCQIYHCETTEKALKAIHEVGGKLFSLSLEATTKLGEEQCSDKLNVYVLGNESNGVSQETIKVCDEKISILMHNNVESLNVAITAALIAFS